MERKITAIKLQKRDPQRVNIYLDGEFAFGLSRLTAAWLSVDRELTEADIEKLLSEDELENAYQKALHFLNFRPRSQQEVRQSLSKKGFADAVIETTLQRLVDQCYVDDRSFAEQWIENRSTFRPRSRRMLSYELSQKGITDQTIQDALEEIGTTEEELAYQAALSRAQRYRSLDWMTFRQKIGGFLARRGFAYNTAAPVIKRLWENCQPPSPGEKFDSLDGAD